MVTRRVNGKGLSGDVGLRTGASHFGFPRRQDALINMFHMQLPYLDDKSPVELRKNSTASSTASRSRRPALPSNDSFKSWGQFKRRIHKDLPDDLTSRYDSHFIISTSLYKVACRGNDLPC
ncbi:unnamed protein product [Caenorhabditis auriculariae]|uniref:Uncharacterized protein n=1 Tax=Caenorhabditis auriculariae TaxID=2777116 RepID=A0A8S1HRZ5_9PELO|nr:unnamed protein product [Caenorhabditis auriculariae]